MQSQNQILPGSAPANGAKSASDARASTASIDVVYVASVVSTDAIRLYAYRKWENAGKPAGDGMPFWLEAEKELVAEKEDTSGRGNSQDADRHSEIRHPHSVKL